MGQLCRDGRVFRQGTAIAGRNERMTDRQRDMVIVSSSTKTLMAILMLGGALVMQPVAVARAGAVDAATFSMQLQGNGNVRGNANRREARQPREARTVQPVPQPQAPRERARGQLTDDERRQLHRDLEKANRELYRGRRQ